MTNEKEPNWRGIRIDEEKTFGIAHRLLWDSQGEEFPLTYDLVGRGDHKTPIFIVTNGVFKRILTKFEEVGISFDEVKVHSFSELSPEEQAVRRGLKWKRS